MSPHSININYKDFKNICRTCMLMCDFKFFEDSVVLNVFFKLTDIHFETNDELPQQICLKCFEKINEIHEFTFQCKRTNFKLTKCLNSSKKLLLNAEVNTNIVKSDFVIKEEISTDDVVNNELKLNQIVLNENDIQKTGEFNGDENQNFSKDDFKNICRTCLLTCDVKFVLDNEILDVCYKLTQIQFETNEQLPKQICSKCYEKIKEIHKFACVCKQTNSTLTKFLNSYKKLQTNEEVNAGIIRSDFVKIEEISPNDIFNNELKIHEDILTEDEIPETRKLNQDTHSDDRLFKCDQCSKCFSYSSVLKNHIRKHSDDRPFKCDFCSKPFKYLNNLRVHMRTHSGERPYECDQCSKSFPQLNHLKKHKGSHNGERPYKCDQCPKSYVFLYLLRNHMRLHNRN